MLEGKYWYAHEKFSKAIYTLATGPGDVRSRLLSVFSDPLYTIIPEHLPDDLQEVFSDVKREVEKYKEEYRGQLAELEKRERLDPTYKDKFAHTYPYPLQVTLNKITNKTGARIACKIFNIWDSLDSRLRDKGR